MEYLNNMQFTQEEQEAIRNQRNEEKYWEELHEAHNRIKKGIANNNNRSGERAIWELMQNARDLAIIDNPAITKIHLTNDSFCFSHKGEPFTLKTLESLIKQRSSKYGKNNTAVGQYGTGFMTTHVLNLKVEVSGSCQIGFNEKTLYVPVHITLDRSNLDNGDAFVRIMDEELREVDGYISRPGYDKPEEWTSFTYSLEPEQLKRVSSQISTTTRLMPYVLLFNERIKECTIIDDTKQTTDYYATLSEEDSPCAYDDQVSFVKTTILYKHNNELQNNIVIYSLRSKDKNDQIVIPPLPAGFDNTDMIPSQFLFFPMLGSEKFGTNFIFHSSRLFPTEPRDSYQLPEDNNTLIPSIEHNKKVLDELFQMLFNYYRHNEEKQHLPIPFAKITFATEGIKRAVDDIQAEYYNKLQKLFVEEFLSYKIFPVEAKDQNETITNEYKALGNGSEVKLIHPEIITSLTAEQIGCYKDVIVKYARMAAVTPSHDVVEWSCVVSDWGVGDNCFVSLNNICGKIKVNEDELYKFLMMLNDLGKMGADAMNNYALIPNREGVLNKRGDLFDGKTIGSDLYNLARPILKTKLDILVKEKYADVYDFPKYTRVRLRDEMKSSIDDLRKLTINHQSASSDNSEPLTLEDINHETKIEHLVRFCSGNNTGDETFRIRVVKTIADLYDLPFEITVIPLVDNDNTDWYESAFNFLVENTMLALSQHNKDWLTTDAQKEENHRKLLEFVKAYASSKNKDNRERMRKYGIFPNQLGEMCRCVQLKKNRVIDSEFTDLYVRIVGNDLHAVWVDDDFSEIPFNDGNSEQESFQEFTPNEAGLEVEKILREYLDNKRRQEEDFQTDEQIEKDLTTIVHKLEIGEWKEYFDYLAQENNLRNISYELGTLDQKEALYRIKMATNQDTLKQLADIMDSPDANEILSIAKERIEQEKEAQRQYAFTYAIGKTIEDELRENISNELDFNYKADDVQHGQDIVISYKEKPLFYLECKAKWNFHDNPAHMSSLQMKQAVRHQDHYALLCVDCTKDTGVLLPPDVTKEQAHEACEDILSHTHVLTDIGAIFSKTIGLQINHEDDYTINENDVIRVYGSYTCNIPKKIFISGYPFSKFKISLKAYLRTAIENNTAPKFTMEEN